jgi:hypothetical protein
VNWLALFAVLAVFCFLLASCGGSEDQKKEKTEKAGKDNDRAANKKADKEKAVEQQAPQQKATPQKDAPQQKAVQQQAPQQKDAQSSPSSGPAPVGTSSTGTWWSPPANNFSPGNLWFFDPVREARPYGWRKGYQPSGTVPANETQYSFVYTSSGNTRLLSFPTGSRQTVAIIDYNAQADVLHINWEGQEEYWVGCHSGRMPALAQAACR